MLKNSPLHIAARHGHYLIVKYLIENGAIPNLPNRDGLSPFDFAEDSKKNLELAIVSNKNKKKPLDKHKVESNLDNLNSIRLLLNQFS